MWEDAWKRPSGEEMECMRLGGGGDGKQRIVRGLGTACGISLVMSSAAE